jgi:hypothetical protein
MILTYEDSICGYEHGRSLWIYFISKDRYFYREYASDCGNYWFNCGFINSDEAIDMIFELADQSDMLGDL